MIWMPERYALFRKLEDHVEFAPAHETNQQDCQKLKDHCLHRGAVSHSGLFKK